MNTNNKKSKQEKSKPNLWNKIYKKKYWLLLKYLENLIVIVETLRINYWIIWSTKKIRLIIKWKENYEK